MPGGRGRRSLPGIGTRGAWMAPAGCFLPVSCSGLRKPCPCSAPGRMGGFRKSGSLATGRICLIDERAGEKGRGCRIYDEAGRGNPGGYLRARISILLLGRRA